MVERQGEQRDDPSGDQVGPRDAPEAHARVEHRENLGVARESTREEDHRDECVQRKQQRVDVRDVPQVILREHLAPGHLVVDEALHHLREVHDRRDDRKDQHREAKGLQVVTDQIDVEALEQGDGGFACGSRFDALCAKTATAQSNYLILSGGLKLCHLVLA